MSALSECVVELSLPIGMRANHIYSRTLRTLNTEGIVVEESRFQATGHARPKATLYIGDVRDTTWEIARDFQPLDIVNRAYEAAGYQ